MRRIFGQLLFLFLGGTLLLACSQKEISISNIGITPISEHATSELQKYLTEIYSNKEFSITKNSSEADIQLMLSSQCNDLEVDVPTQDESFKILVKNDKLLIIGADERGLLNAVYALLEKLGCGFYISGDVLPKTQKWKGFNEWEMVDEPLIGDRFLFNWHNFLSGCTGWNLDNWQQWIDQANKMRYNGIMVHAYGNNPMFSFSYLGEKKQTGYLNNTASGRDWGNQHVNDVRRLVGGEISDSPVYGAKASFASGENKEKEATKLMQQVFSYAEARGTKVIFALDFDTWMSNPQNIVKKLPKEALFDLNGYLTPNPEHPEGYKYYKHQLKELLTKYPQIDELTAWSRSPNKKANSKLGTIWMAFPYEKFPETWKAEYKIKLAQFSDIDDDLMAQGMFAFSKIITALKKAATEIKPELEIGYGSWNFHWLPIADAFLPPDVPLLPLDATISFDSEKNKEILAETGANRKVCPIVWAHHDDFSYIGRPYAPYKNLSDMAAAINIQGLGIIHWTTHPLDIYFSGTSKQLWKASENEPLEKTVEDFVKARFGIASPELLKYYNTWMSTGPMFGRETSDHFIDLGKLHWKSKLKPWRELIPEANERIRILESVPENLKNNYWSYQKGIEEFYISFFENQAAFTEAYNFVEKGNYEKATQLMKNTNPDETIVKYVEALKHIGFTAGEKALVISLNLRWKADFLNLKQRLGLEPVQIRFSPTQHDPLAQMPGLNTYEMDTNKDWWICKWAHELPENVFSENEQGTALIFSADNGIKLQTMHGQNLKPGAYQLEISSVNNASGKLFVYSNGKLVSAVELNGSKTNKIKFACDNCEELFLKSNNNDLKIKALKISPFIN